MSYWEFVAQKLWPALNQGFMVSLGLIIPSIILGLALGVFIGFGRAAGPRWLAVLLNGYVTIFRGTPLLVQMMVIYYGLPNLAAALRPFFNAHGWPPLWKIFTPGPFAAAVLSFTLCSGAYHSEYIRGAILSIKKGQLQAAKSLGFSRWDTFWSIIFPQAARRALPGCGNEIIYLIKYSSLAFIIACMDLLAQAKHMAGLNFRFMTSYSLVAVYYLLMVGVATWILKKIERKTAIPGFGQN